ncbi:uncharacterized protein N7459_004539 [Penicillium hispanicum]|uniref:uncharacterized protein n=1 Tax=Penicillium hispanicum TaxID=1080232 RepID=UPI002541CC25|nr:uncharacterized protein N7459_004539 [Penicillium hispanicum]KAJ5584739.1 hypothetical protein N7459_004539 [Penicillium hispanicum]
MELILSSSHISNAEMHANPAFARIGKTQGSSAADPRGLKRIDSANHGVAMPSSRGPRRDAATRVRLLAPASLAPKPSWMWRSGSLLISSQCSVRRAVIGKCVHSDVETMEFGRWSPLQKRIDATPVERALVRTEDAIAAIMQLKSGLHLPIRTMRDIPNIQTKNDRATI